MRPPRHDKQLAQLSRAEQAEIKEALSRNLALKDMLGSMEDALWDMIDQHFQTDYPTLRLEHDMHLRIKQEMEHLNRLRAKLGPDSIDPKTRNERT